MVLNKLREAISRASDFLALKERDRVLLRQNAAAPIEVMPRLEVIAVPLLVAALAYACWLLTMQTSLVWYDEVYYAEPAANFALGHGFTSASWEGAPYGTFWVGKPFAQPLGLGMWMIKFGFSRAAVHALNWFLLSGAAINLWLAAWRSRLLRSSRARALFVGAVMTGSSSYSIAAFGRYDAACLAVWSSVVFQYAWVLGPPFPPQLAKWSGRKQGPIARLFMALMAGATASLIGLPLVLALALIALATVFRWRLVHWSHLAALAAGFVVGEGVLLQVYDMFGALPYFTESFRHHVLTGWDFYSRSGWVDPSTWCLLLALFLLIKRADKGSGELEQVGVVYATPNHHLTVSPAESPADRVAARVAAWPWLREGWLFAIGSALIFAIVGKFSIYYAWIAFVPALLASLAFAERTGLRIWPLVAASAIWLPAWAVIALANAPIRDAAALEKFVSTQIRPGDVVFADYAAYYAARRETRPDLPPISYFVMSPEQRKLSHAQYLYLYWEHGVIGVPEKEKARVNVVMVAPEEIARVTEFFGGKWEEVARYAPTVTLSPLLPKLRGYDLVVLRRTLAVSMQNSGTH